MILYFSSKILTRAQMLLASTMPSAKLSLHLMPVVYVMTTARRTKSPYVHLTLQHSRTSAFVYWTFANAKVTTRFIILAAVQVIFLGFFTLLLCCQLQSMRRSTRPEKGLSIAFVSAFLAQVPLLALALPTNTHTHTHTHTHPIPIDEL